MAKPYGRTPVSGSLARMGDGRLRFDAVQLWSSMVGSLIPQLLTFVSCLVIPGQRTGSFNRPANGGTGEDCPDRG